jgi:hypothetical protein
VVLLRKGITAYISGRYLFQVHHCLYFRKLLVSGYVQEIKASHRREIVDTRPAGNPVGSNLLYLVVVLIRKDITAQSSGRYLFQVQA